MTDSVATGRAKVRVSVAVETVLEFDDDGYLGTGASVEEHLKKARTDLGNCSFLVKRGALDAKVVPAKFKVLSVTIIPKES